MPLDTFYYIVKCMCKS